LAISSSLLIRYRLSRVAPLMPTQPLSLKLKHM